MKDALVSIITPVYNAEKFIRETIESVQNQTYTNWEMLLINDCSTDSSAEIIKEKAAEDSRIKYIELDKNSGAAITRNTGISKAQGRYIAFLDSDDIWKSDKLDKQLALIKEKDIGFCFTSYRYVMQDGVPTNKVARAPEKIDYNGLLKNTIIGCSTVLIDREVMGDFRMTNVRRGQDTATWLQLLKRTEYAYGIYEDLVWYRVVDGSLSHNKWNAIKRTWNTYRNVEHLSLPKAMYVFVFYAYNALKKRIKNEK
ncbi:MAG: Putative teichuronic acid biosynthesis glycosyltransferase TuaG [Peptostreptococcus russellii]|uniref:Glycosyl transferase n=1 Tax=Peptostreptococcus russellii TaxID=215200 RepID=A0A2P7Q0X6_9FIRM|nr:glycosyltransferase family 2 protein [Peptostreptococcus russellii]PSJ31590.1 glycosyl transferase [Peptostreptococcus russellii]